MIWTGWPPSRCDRRRPVFGFLSFLVTLPELLFGDPDFDPELLLPGLELLLVPVPWLLFGFEEFDPDFPELLELLLVELLLAPEPAELLVADGLDELFEPSLDPPLPAPYPDLVPDLDPWFPVCLP